MPKTSKTQEVKKYDNSFFEKGGNKMNKIELYRRDQGMTYLSLSNVLEISKKSARAACKLSVPPRKHLHQLAAHEGMTINEFDTIFFSSQIA